MAEIRGIVVLHESLNNKEEILRNINWIIPHRLGTCDVPCGGRGALHFKKEQATCPKNHTNTLESSFNLLVTMQQHLAKETDPYPQTPSLSRINMAEIRGIVVPHESFNNEKSILGNINWIIPHRLGKCDVPCGGCGALHWRFESSLKDREDNIIQFSMCCQKNQVTLPHFDASAREYPKTLKDLLVGRNESKCIRSI
ncbi:hypothetical protein Pst134EA_015147 [Puccinia striiformis f. sp. tritici]|uniref:hypothetical protein n=1 Tax=Puccinia striiformis f. sp. tritici TaxID=168172 RepID=UPI002008C5CA|nr:hypothetical protein Pst134EA_015147 [Puccinia striiformis f. sp. tritici]KAH9463060.1 hypothetical protein Pst134EA_015147 [Puccinia striiformis f. sp. tritici]